MADTTQVIRIVVDSSGAQNGGRVVKRSLDDIKGSADAAQQALNGLGRAGSGLDNLHRSAQQAEGGFGRLRGSIANLGYQIQDAAVQLQMGTNAFVVFAQQGSQAASAFGPVGAIIGTLIALGGTLGSVLFSTSKETEKAATAADFMGRAYATAADDVEKLTAKFEKLGKAQRNLEQINLLGALKKEREELTKNVDSLQKAIEAAAPSDFFGGMGVTEKLKPVVAALKEIKDQTIPADKGLQNVEIALRRSGLAAGFIETAVLAAAGAVGKSGTEVSRMEAMLALLAGTATAAQRDLLNFGNAAKASADMARDATKALKEGYEAAIKTALPLDEAARQRDERRISVNAALEGGVIDLAAAQKALTGIDQEYAEQVDKINSRLGVREKAALKDANAHEAGIDAVEDYIAKIRGEAEGLGMTDRARAIYAAGLEVERIAKGRLNDDETAKYIEQARKEAGAMYDVKQAHDEAKKASEEYKRAVEKTTDDVVRYSADAFADMIGNGKKSWKDLFNTIEKWAVQTAARIAAEMIIRPIVQPVVAGLVGSAPGLFGVSQASASTLTGGQSATGSTSGILDLFSSGSKLFSSGSGSLSPGLDAWAQSTFGFGQMATAAGLGSASGGLASSLGVAAVPGGVVNAAVAPAGLLNSGSALAGFGSLSNILGIGGAILPGLLSGNYAQAAAGGIGAAIGTAILPGIGTAIGGLLGNLAGGLFGKKGGDIPAASGQATYSGGEITSTRSDTDNKGDPGVARQLADATSTFMQSVFTAGGLTDYHPVNYGVETKKGEFQYMVGGKSSGKYGTLDEALIAGLRAAATDTNGGAMFGGDAKVMQAIERSKATTAEQFVKDIDLAKNFDATLKRLAGGAGSTSAALEEMRAAAAELGKKGKEQILDWRDKVIELGLSTEKDLNAPLLNAVKAMAGLTVVEEPLVGLAAVAERTSLNFAALQPTLAALGQTAEQQAEIAAAMQAKAKAAWDTSIGLTKRQADMRLALAGGNDAARLSYADIFEAAGYDRARAGVQALVDTFENVRKEADKGVTAGGAYIAVRTQVDALLDSGRISAEQYGQMIGLLSDEITRGIDVAKTAAEATQQAADEAKRVADEAKQAAEAATAAEKERIEAMYAAARATRDFNADLRARSQTLLGNSTGAALTGFDLQAAQAIEAATANGQDVGGLRIVLAAERAQLVYDQAVTDYKDGLSRQAAALEEANTALAANIDLAKGFRAAYNSLALADASPLDGFSKLEEARRQFTAIATAYNAATDAGEKSGLASQLQSLGQRRIELAQGYYASSNRSDYDAVRELFDQLGVSSDTTQTQIEQNQAQLDAIRSAQKAAEQIGQRQLGSLDSLQSIMAGAKATLDAQLAVLAASQNVVAPAPVAPIVSATTYADSVIGERNSWWDANAGKYNYNLAQTLNDPAYAALTKKQAEAIAAVNDTAWIQQKLAEVTAMWGENTVLGAQLQTRTRASGIPGFASGGITGNIARIHNDELLWTGKPVQVFSPAQSRQMMGSANDSEIVAELRALREEVKALMAITAAGSIEVTGAVRQGNVSTADMAATARREAAAPKVA